MDDEDPLKPEPEYNKTDYRTKVLFELKNRERASWSKIKHVR